MSRPDWSRPLPRPLTIPTVMKLKTLADVRDLVEKHLPEQYRRKPAWRQVSTQIAKPAEGEKLELAEKRIEELEAELRSAQHFIGEARTKLKESGLRETINRVSRLPRRGCVNLRCGQELLRAKPTTIRTPWLALKKRFALKSSRNDYLQTRNDYLQTNCHDYHDPKGPPDAGWNRALAAKRDVWANMPPKCNRMIQSASARISNRLIRHVGDDQVHKVMLRITFCRCRGKCGENVPYCQ